MPSRGLLFIPQITKCLLFVFDVNSSPPRSILRPTRREGLLSNNLSTRLVSICLVLSAVAELRRVNTVFDARKSTTAIVTSGAFRISRNPTYLSLSMLSIGIAFVVSSVWLIATSTIAIGVTHWGVILREEAYLRNKFGESYINYTAEVQRWL